jgi:hypothetical protein
VQVIVQAQSEQVKRCKGEEVVHRGGGCAEVVQRLCRAGAEQVQGAELQRCSRAGADMKALRC